MAARCLLVTISPVDAGATLSHRRRRDRLRNRARPASREPCTRTPVTATACNAVDEASVSRGSADTWRPTSSTCSDGLAATSDSTTLTSFRMLGVEVSQTTASIFFASMRSITARTDAPDAGASTRSTSCPFFIATPAAVASHFG